MRRMPAVSRMECVKSVLGVILDMCGVLYDSGEDGGQSIHGSVQAKYSTCVILKLRLSGKPALGFFHSVSNNINLQPQVVMSVVLSFVGLQVRTGKFRPSNENHLSVRADAYADDLTAAVDAILTHLDTKCTDQ